MNNLSVILHSSNDVLQAAALRLEKDGKIQVKTVLAWTSKNNNTFAMAETINQWDLINSGLAGKFEGADIRLLSSDLTAKTRWSESITLSMMDRIDPIKKQTYFERKNLYNYLICYWAAYVKKTNPKALICTVVPHEVSDFILFVVCKALNVKTIVFNYTRLPGMVYVSDGYASFPRFNTAETNHSLIRKELSEGILTYLAEIRASCDDATPVDSIEILTKSHKLQSGLRMQAKLNSLKRICCLPIKLLKVLKNYNTVTILTAIHDFAQTRLNAIAWSETKREYTKYSANFQKPDKFVYFLLNLQPECTTSPMGGEFVDQLLAIAMLARNLPANTYLLVKEHPVQLIEFEHYNSLGRDVNFYHRICSLSNVRLVPMNVDHFDLLDTSLCVACVNGTAGWEAVVRGKSALVFGEAWYQGAPNVYKIQDDVACKAAIDAINNGVVPSKDAFISYLEMFLNECDEICLDEDYARFSCIPFDFEENVNQVHSALTLRLFASNGAG